MNYALQQGNTSLGVKRGARKKIGLALVFFIPF